MTVLTVLVVGRKKLWLSIISPKFSLVNICNVINIFFKVGYFKRAGFFKRVGIKTTRTPASHGRALCNFGKPVTAEGHPLQGGSAEAEKLICSAAPSANMSPCN